MRFFATLASLAALAAATVATTAQSAGRHESPGVTVRPAAIAKPRPQQRTTRAARPARTAHHHKLTALQRRHLRAARHAARVRAARRIARSHPGRAFLHRLPQPKPSNAVKSPAGAPATAPASSAPATDAVQAPNDPAWPREWSLAQVHAPQAWKLSNAAHGVVVAVVDSGVDPSQPDLQGALVAGYNALDGGTDTSDSLGHGTMVAGVIAARAGNGIGVAGTCAACSIMPVKVLDASGSGSAAGMADGIRWAVDHGASIINLSLVLSGDDPSVRAAIAYAVDRGILVVAAAGNASNNTQTFPASYPGVVSVAATDNGDHAYSWTTYGPWVSVAAPGCSMSTAPGGAYGEFCGTSAAAPLVAGLAGLALSTGRPTPAAVGAALQATAVPLPGVVGAGRVDALTLLQQYAS